jgi:hypothetical protein
VEQVGLLYALVYEFNGKYVANNLMEFTAKNPVNIIGMSASMD